MGHTLFHQASMRIWDYYAALGFNWRYQGLREYSTQIQPAAKGLR
jgi:hypothetical protein